MNLDPCMKLECFTKDQVHFKKANRVIGKVIISVVNRSAMIERRVEEQPVTRSEQVQGIIE